MVKCVVRRLSSVIVVVIVRRLYLLSSHVSTLTLFLTLDSYHVNTVVLFTVRTHDSARQNDAADLFTYRVVPFVLLKHEACGGLKYLRHTLILILSPRGAFPPFFDVTYRTML